MTVPGFQMNARKLVVFLRAINVGGHTVKMDALKRLFEKMGFLEVETFIASGNVIFGSAVKNPEAVEKTISSGLKSALGYEVASFVRTLDELAKTANYKAFPKAALESAAALNVAFIHKTPDETSKRELMKLRTDIDDFAINGREIYWLCRKRQSESDFSNAVFEKALGISATWRNINTVRKLAEKYPVK